MRCRGFQESIKQLRCSFNSFSFSLKMILLKLVACTIFAISVESQHNERWNPSGEFPFYVLIKQGDMFWCSGSLIRTQWVITSWHCAETLKIDESTTVESFDQVKNVALKRQIEVEAWFWNHETPYLLKLAEPFEITSKTGVIALSSRRISDFQVVKVVGDGDLTNLKFDYFIQVRTTWDKKMKQMPLSPGKDCYVSNEIYYRSSVF